MMLKILTCIAVIGWAPLAFSGGSGVVFSVPQASERMSGPGVLGIAKSYGIDVNKLRNRSSLREITGDVDLSDAIVVEGANTISRQYMGSGSTFSVDWDRELVEFEDASSADFEAVVDEAIELETSGE